MTAVEPTVALVVPATDRPPTLARCLTALRAQLGAQDELICVDAPGNLAPGTARNQGASRATAEILVFVDADVEVGDGAIARMRAAFARDPGLTAVFGSYDDAPEAHGLVSRFRNLLHHDVHQRCAGPATTFWSGLGAVRREVFLAAGGFDRSFAAPSIEDIELGMRLTRSGARLELDPGIQGKHLKRWTLASMLKTDFVRRGLPWARLQLRSRSASRALNLGWRHRLSAGTSTLAAGALAATEMALVVTAAAALVALNARFYALLVRRVGPTAAVAGPALHALHHLTGVAALICALGLHAGGGARRRAAAALLPRRGQAAVAEPAPEGTQR